MRLLLILVLGLGCGRVEDGRTPWLVEQIIRDNRPWLSRDLDLLRFKFRRMSLGSYDYMRGTAGVYLRDLERTGPERLTTSFLVEPEAAHVTIIGDPHPENFGCFLPGDPHDDPATSLRIESNDFDAVAHGPWLWDVRRGAVGLRALMEPVTRCDEACRDDAVEGFARGYVEQIQALDRGEGGVLPTQRGASVTVDRLLQRCQTRGPQMRRLNGETFLDDEGVRRVRIDAEWDERGRANFEHDPLEKAQIDRLVAQWERQNPGFRVVDTARAYGRGVASMPAIRYLVVIERDEDIWPKEQILQIREVIDPPAVPGLREPIEGLYKDQAERIRGVPRDMWSHPEADPRNDAVVDGPVTFKVSTWESYFDGFDAEDMSTDFERGRVPVQDAAALGRHLGALLAGHHARGRTALGRRSLSVIAKDLGEDGADRLAEELVEGTRADWLRILDDYERFLGALDRLGPILGVDTIYTENIRR